MEASVLLPPWRSGDVESLPDVLAEHATFSSPVADHNGQAKTAHMLGLIARVLEDVEKTAQWNAERETGYWKSPRTAPGSSRLWVPITPSTSCDQAIFVDQATDGSLSSDAVLVEIDRFGQRFQRRGTVQAAVRPMLVVVALVIAQDPPQMVLVPDEGAVQELASASPDPAFGDRVRPSRGLLVMRVLRSIRAGCG